MIFHIIELSLERRQFEAMPARESHKIGVCPLLMAADRTKPDASERKVIRKKTVIFRLGDFTKNGKCLSNFHTRRLFPLFRISPWSREKTKKAALRSRGGVKSVNRENIAPGTGIKLMVLDHTGN